MTILEGIVSYMSRGCIADPSSDALTISASHFSRVLCLTSKLQKHQQLRLFGKTFRKCIVRSQLTMKCLFPSSREFRKPGPGGICRGTGPQGTHYILGETRNDSEDYPSHGC